MHSYFSVSKHCWIDLICLTLQPGESFETDSGVSMILTAVFIHKTTYFNVILYWWTNEVYQGLIRIKLV